MIAFFYELVVNCYFGLLFSISMKSIRPYTAPKDSNGRRPDSKQLIPGFKRPLSAKTHSLKQIIQVIQQTLNQGSQTILTKAKTLDRFSKFKQHLERSRRQRDRHHQQKQLPQFKTEFMIGNSGDFQSTCSSVTSAKILAQGYQQVEFVPYNTRNPLKKSANMAKKSIPQKVAVRRGREQIKTAKAIQSSQADENMFNVIDGWQSEHSIVNFSNLLQDRRA